MSKPLCFTDPDALEAQVKAYFDHCKQSQKVYDLKSGDVKIRKQFPTMTGLALWLKCRRETLYSYINGEEKPGLSDENNEKISNTLSRAKQAIADELMQAAIAGDADSRIAGMLLTAMGETQPETQNVVQVVIQGDSDAYSM
ncbi:MAG: hypothetical protein II556_02235 [Bacteroidales bacterium]|nr:hypothetical protein [Bacteroidales bacterium]